MVEISYIEQLVQAVKTHLQSEWISQFVLREELGISLKTQANMRSAKKLPYYRIGNTIRYKRSEIDALFESAKVQS